RLALGRIPDGQGSDGCGMPFALKGRHSLLEKVTRSVMEARQAPKGAHRVEVKRVCEHPISSPTGGTYLLHAGKSCRSALSRNPNGLFWLKGRRVRLCLSHGAPYFPRISPHPSSP